MANPRWHTIGILGGMGPAASAAFLTSLVRAAGGEHDEAKPRILLDSNPHVPDRNAAVAGGPSPGPELAAMAARLMAQGATVLAMPCNAAHGWAAAIEDVLQPGVRFISLIEAASAAVLAHAPARVGLMAVGATHQLRLYARPLEAAGVAVLAPDPARLAALVGRVKAGDTGPAARAEAAAMAAALVAEGADLVLAACTEIPLALAAADCTVPFVDAGEALVSATIAAAQTAG